ncbi:hypothetical protein QJQ45_010908 [Haematococcus lacustris]|nr:hypothetical protein QJQ45_010908 [Haematococcus lacustris]
MLLVGIAKLLAIHAAACIDHDPAFAVVVVVNELRSHTIQQAFIDTFNTTHVLKQVPQARLHEDYRHPLIQVFVCKKKRRAPLPAQGAMVEAATDVLHMPPHEDVGEVGMPVSTTPGPSSLQGYITPFCQSLLYHPPGHAHRMEGYGQYKPVGTLDGLCCEWLPLELCFWPEQGALPAKGKEYPGLGYKRLRDKPPKAQEQQPAVAQ